MPSSLEALVTIASAGVMGLVVFLHYIYFPISSSPPLSPPPQQSKNIESFNPEVLQRLQRSSRSTTSSVSSVSTIGGRGEQIASTKLALKALNLLLRENVIDAARRSELKRLILSSKPNPRAVRAVEEFEMHGDPKRFLQDILTIS